jgi:hypothetical protein
LQDTLNSLDSSGIPKNWRRNKTQKFEETKCFSLLILLEILRWFGARIDGSMFDEFDNL